MAAKSFQEETIIAAGSSLEGSDDEVEVEDVRDDGISPG
jgi:hypothetical protein